MPVKKSVRSKTSTGAKKSPRSKAKSGTPGAGVILMAVVCVMAVAMVMAARESDTPAVRTADVPAQFDAEATRGQKVAASKPSLGVPAATPTTGVVAAGETDVESAPASPATKSGPVTITGCLQRDSDSFRLKDTTGADVPKARSWKSGFLKKGSASIDLVDAAGGSTKFRDHVGERVSVTGTLRDREMKVRTLRRVAPSCN